MAKGSAGKPIQGRRSWSLRLWARYLMAAKSPVEARRRLELARLESRSEMLSELESVAARRISDLESSPAVDVVAPPAELELPAPDDVMASDGAERDFGSWWRS